MAKNSCDHCGLPAGREVVKSSLGEFCCKGCETIYELIHDLSLEEYYQLNDRPGIRPDESFQSFEFLKDPSIYEKFLDFQTDDLCVVEFWIPSIHCSSCIWILENLEGFNKGIKYAKVNFSKKEVRITYNPKVINLYNLVGLLHSLAYAPVLESKNNREKQNSRREIYQISLAAFGFGNIMLLSFPEYFQIDEFWLNKYQSLFRWMIIVLSIPVVAYSAQDYFKSAYAGLKNKILNMDVPISIGIGVLLVRSLSDVFLDRGPGYFDSLTGLIFFLLVGKFFQNKTYKYLSFERDYKSYFPIGVSVVNASGGTETKSIEDLEKGDVILLHNNEVLPADGIIKKGEANIDYSFVTGESLPIVKKSGDLIYAGAIHTGSIVEVEISHSVSSSYLTKLWSNTVFTDNAKSFTSLIDRIAKNFTKMVLLIAFLGGVYWSFIGWSEAINVISSILIVVCPCAISLALPFALGNILRIFGKHKIYLKNTDAIEKLAGVDHIVFDKTGTLTSIHEALVRPNFKTSLNDMELQMVKTLTFQSKHPLSQLLFQALNDGKNFHASELGNFKEFPGKGIVGEMMGTSIRMGSSQFLGQRSALSEATDVHLEIGGVYRGFFQIENKYRSYIKDLFRKLRKFSLSVLSGDDSREKMRLAAWMPLGSGIHFNQSPQDKLDFISQLQENNSSVLMVGDGLNDAGALKQADVGFALTEDSSIFSPSSDGILDAESLSSLPEILRISKKTMRIVQWSFVGSFIYNSVGLYFALTNSLTPVIAAILMPLSSISVVIFVTFATNTASKSLKIKS